MGRKLRITYEKCTVKLNTALLVVSIRDYDVEAVRGSVCIKSFI